MAAARPATGMPLLQPVLTPQPSLSYSTMGSVERARLAICSAKAGGPCGRTAPSHGESGRVEHVCDLDREPLASGKLNPPLTRTSSRARGPPSITPTRLAAACTTCPRWPSLGTLLRRLRGFPGCNQLGRACPRRVVHAYRTARGGELGESRRDARATMARCRVEWLYSAHGESLREACGSGRRCPPRPPPGKPSRVERT